MDIKPGEIVLCDIKIKGKKIVELKNVIFSRFYDCEFPILKRKQYSFFFNKNKIKEDQVVVQSINVNLRTGFKHKTKIYK